MSQKLYEYCVLYHPKGRKPKDGEEAVPPKSELIQDVTRVLADNDAQVSILAARAIPEKYLDRLEQIEISVRPF